MIKMTLLIAILQTNGVTISHDFPVIVESPSACLQVGDNVLKILGETSGLKGRIVSGRRYCTDPQPYTPIPLFLRKANGDYYE